MAETGLKEMVGTKAPKFGHFIVEFATPGIGHILKSAGCDFVLFDLEHSGFRFETVKSVVRYFEAAELPRHRARAVDATITTSPAPGHGRRGPDAADGRARAEEAAAHPRSHEVSSRKASAAWRCRSRMTATGPGAVADKFAAANERSTFFCQIETAEGVENADAIAAIDGVDCLWVGHFDLSVSLGIPGQFDHPNFTQRDRHGRQPPPQARQGARPPGAECRDRHRALSARASISSAIRAMSGCCTTRSDRGDRQAARRHCKTQARKGMTPWPHPSASRSRAISARPTARRPIPDFDLEPLHRRARRRDGRFSTPPIRSGPSSSRISTR